MRLVRLLTLCVALAGCGDDVRGSCDCDPATEYCWMVSGDSSSRQCWGLPEECALDVTCDCLAGAGVAYDASDEWCEADDDGMVTVVYPYK